jgi:hypothetical protein
MARNIAIEDFKVLLRMVLRVRLDISGQCITVHLSGSDRQHARPRKPEAETASTAKHVENRKLGT